MGEGIDKVERYDKRVEKVVRWDEREVDSVRRKDMISSFMFFFSSRRRHTRLQGDWSSDVCSSDLG